MDKIKIGKNTIENITTGMYHDSKIIFREYIQNSADQIDKALKENMFPEEDMSIEITIEEEERNITIKDNATGVSEQDIIKKLAYVADSEKERGVDKGFRGIGRLGGLAYCETLTFTTTYKGENVKTIMIWDAKKLMSLIEDNKIKDSAEEILQKIISYKKESCDEKDHFFMVELLKIRKENKDLLKLDDVREYIGMNAPIAYNNKFLFRSKIYEFLNKNHIPKNEYKIHVNGEDIFKPYGTYLYDNSSGQAKKFDEIVDIQIETFKQVDGQLLGWMWYGLCSFEKAIPSSVNPAKGIRLRQSNIQLGDEKTFLEFFKESRGVSYFIGEVHAIHKDLVPNARRDYFNENEIRNEFEKQLKCYFFSTLNELYRKANKLKNKYKKDIDLKEKIKEYESKENKGFVDQKEQENFKNEIKKKEEENKKAQNEILNLKSKVSKESPLSRVVERIEKNYQKKLEDNELVLEEKSVSNEETREIKSKTLYITSNLSKLDKKQQKLVAKIYSVIKDILPPDLSEELIEKIQVELSR